MINRKLAENPLRTRDDVAKAIGEILRPLERHFRASGCGIRFDGEAAGYPERTMEIEALLRPLWGILPLLSGGGEYPFFEKYIEKIANGVNPGHEDYWGEISGFDQRMVEMAVPAFGMVLAKDVFWAALTDEQRDNLCEWLWQINRNEMPESNWRFFRVLVNLGLKNCGRPFDDGCLRKDLELLDSFYVNDGWYFDGEPGRIDYYVPWAMHFYGLVYSAICPDDEYARRFKERAKLFAPSFAAFFADDGAAVPFGRSMTYRFAQSAFFGALAIADVEALPWGQVKHLALQNLRYWFGKDIFSASGELTVGYHYRGSAVAEGYNAFGSPYWALKAFVMMAVPGNHPFWTSDEEKPRIPSRLCIPEARCIVERDGSQVQTYTVGRHIFGKVSGGQHKYEKFVYSSHFGFSVAKGALGLPQGAFDNTLAVSEDDEFYRMRNGVAGFQVFTDRLFSRWQPWKDVTVDTHVILFFPWHIRLHIIETARTLSLADGGFAISAAEVIEKPESANSCAVIRPKDASGVVSLLGEQKPEIVVAEPNTNIMEQRTLIPTLLSKLAPGRHVLASAVLGAKGGEPAKAWGDVPCIGIEGDRCAASHGARTVAFAIG